MKHKLSITVDEDTLIQINDILRSKTFRNKSHFFEVAAKNLIENRGKSK
jgi:metal-responsive CopG/Arc/MetJ family transcriptional regulator